MEDLCTGSGLDPLWDWNLTWYTTRPDLSLCFQKTVLVWSPCIYLWTCSPLYLIYLHVRQARGVIPLSRLCCSKTLLGLGLASLGLLEMFYLLVKNQKIQNHLLVLMGPLVRSITLVLAVMIMWVERKKGTRSSILLFLFWTLLVLCSIVPLKVEVQQIINQGFSDDALRSTAIFICFSLQVVQLILSCFCDVRPDGNHVNSKECPEKDSSFLSKFFFFWFSSLVIQGYRRPLLAGDLWTLREQDSSSRIMMDLEKFWAPKSKDLQTRSKTGSPTLTEKTPLMTQISREPEYHFLVLSTLGRNFGLHFLSGTLCLLLHDAVMFSIPQVLSQLLSYMQEVDAPQWKGFLFAILLFLFSCLQSLLHHHYMLHCFTVGMRIKTAIMGLVYRKSLLMSSMARQQCTLGEIINLVSADTQKLMDFVVYFNNTWMAPIEIAVCFYFLWQLLGPPALAGVSAVLLIFPLNGFIAKLRSKLQEVQMKFTDGRIKLMNEILGGVKILKFYSWEEAFLRRVGELRDGELGALKTSQILYSVSLASFNSSSFLIALSVFGVYVLIDDRNVLDAEKIFVSVALINILKTPLSQLPFAMSTTMQALVSLKRLGNFLSQDEVKMENVERQAYRREGNAVMIEGGVFSWSNHGTACLHNINITLKTGSLVAVVGHVGSGKSSLMSAMLGEMERWSGVVRLEGSVAYMPQQAWIQNASLRDNILFGREWNQTWYHRVLDACALLPDLSLLPAGDGTEIGEKGLNLSGGQKQRVSLARAVYRKSDIYLLDDPLSALDAHVGQQVFNRVLGPTGLLRDKTRVLVTHGLGFLSKADLILVLDQGHICEIGSYVDLMDRKGVFFRFIQTSCGPLGRETTTPTGPGPYGPRDKGRKSLSRLSITDFSMDLSQEQLISSTSIQVMEVMDVMEDEMDGGAGDAGKLTEADRAQTGRVSLQTYTQYFRTVGLTFIMTMVFLGAFQQAASLAYSYWLSLWADETTANQQGTPFLHTPLLPQDVTAQPVNAMASLNSTRSDYQLRLSVFAALGFTQGLALFGTTLAIALGGIIASRRLHADLLFSVLRSPVAFFEATPSGNLLNRFSREVDAIDCMIPDGLKMMLGYLFKLLEVLVIVLVATPLSGLVLLPLACLYIFIQSFYVSSSCQLRRLEAVSRSPVYSHFNETVQGAAVIRAFEEQQRFILQNDRRVDVNQEAYFPRFVATRWLAVNLEFLGNLLVLATAMFSVRSHSELSPGVVGLVVTHSLQVTGILSWIVRSWTDVENNIVSVERVKEYDVTPKEAAWTTDVSLSASWPNSGTIQFEDFGLQYRPGLDWALVDICVDIQDKEKIGIVGRTGAGKSSLALGIFRILEPANGRILIDGIDITQIGLRDLRSRITIIPQDPVLFSGTLRMNLDPFESCTDDDLWKALDLAHMSSFVSGLPGKLDYECCEGGENLSLGQRQLLCLARALLRKSKILILDEATAAVDLNMDRLIQSTIRTQFKDCTVLTIAHRLNTIMDYTRVVVMERGSVVEIDSPTQLLHLQGVFYQMCVEAGVV